MGETIIYRRRESVFKSGETEWRADDDGLTRREPDGTETSLKWADVRFVRLRYNPTPPKPWLHMSRIVSTNTLMVLDNGHYRGVGDFDDRSRDYSALMRKALVRIAVAAPNAQIATGSDMQAYVAQIAVLAVALAAVAAVLLLLPLPLPLPLAVPVKLLVIVTGLPLLWRWFRTNRPRRLSAAEAIASLPK
jgi:hypothetical protein